jgi:tRNA(Ile)-lysidine synthase
MAGHEAPFAVAVSGGSDSLALMHLLAALARAAKQPLPVVLTVDHGLRKASGDDARQVVRWAKKCGLKAHVLAWRGKKPKSGIEALAREARYQLMGAWMLKHGVGVLFVGHTQDDQAETFLLRLARGSGLDGLLGQDWLDDPMNEDLAFDRVKLRRARAALEKAGLSAARIALAASHLARARESLELLTEAVMERAVRFGGRGVLLDPEALAAAPRELGLRALASVLMAVSGQAYRPRFDALERLFDALERGGARTSATLHGCHIGPAGADFAPFSLLVRREGPRKA